MLQLPLRETVRAPAMVLAGTLEVEYRSIVVPVVRSAESEEALVTAARLAAERRSRVAVVHVLEIPMELPLTARLPSGGARGQLAARRRARPRGELGVRAVTRLERARAAGPAIVADVVARDAELVVLGAPRRGIGRRAPVFGHTARYVLKHSPCRVLVAAPKPATKAAACGRVRAARVFSILLIALGVAVVARTIALGVGGGLGLLLGGLMIVAGVLRLWMTGGAWRRG